MTKRKNLFKNISLFLCLVPMLLLSLFCLVPNKDKMQVSALGDQVITNFNFVSSKILVPVTCQYTSNDAFDRQNFSMINISFGRTDGIITATIYGITGNDTYTSYYEVYGYLNNVNNEENLVANTNFLYVYVNPNSNTNYRYVIRVFHSGQLTSDIIKVTFDSYKNSSQNISSPAPFYNTITYYDSQGEFIQFEFPLYANGGDLARNLLFDERTYYFTSSFDDNTFYQNGYEDGLDDGYNLGKEDGYKIGYNNGEIFGYGNGYNAGLEYGGNYSFLSLIGAVIDAPISAFTSLLNFNLLGFNMLGFVTGLITLCLIIFIVKLILGGK